MRLVRDAKARGVTISCECTPHHFVLTDEAVETYGSMAKMNPPLRTQEDINAIIEGLKDGTIDCISTDHAPHATHDKETDIVTAAFGIIGLETAVGLGLTYLVHPGHLSLMEYVKHSSQNPRRLLKLDEIRIEEGQPANLTILDLDRSWTFGKEHIFSRSSNTPFVGHSLKGMPVGTINNGQVWWRT